MNRKKDCFIYKLSVVNIMFTRTTNGIKVTCLQSQTPLVYTVNYLTGHFYTFPEVDD